MQKHREWAMKTRINFCQDNLKPKIELLNLNFTIATLVFSILLIIAISTSLNYQHTKVQKSVDNLTVDVEKKQELIKSLIEANEARTQDPAIIARIEKSLKELNSKKAIIDELKARETQKSNGFSSLMVDLASNHQPALWLTNINLDERKLYLEGTTSDSSALPKWVNQLGQAAYFNGKDFAGARMFRDDNQMLNFVLSSELDEVSGAKK